MTLPTSPALTYSIRRVDHPPTYYEVFTPAAGSTKPPVVMIHGGAHTGACYLATPTVDRDGGTFLSPKDIRSWCWIGRGLDAAATYPWRRPAGR